MPGTSSRRRAGYLRSTKPPVVVGPAAKPFFGMQNHAPNGNREWSTTVLDKLQTTYNVPLSMLREEFMWEKIERTQGNYYWNGTNGSFNFDQMMADYNARGIQILGEYLWSHPIYDPDKTTLLTGSGQPNEKKLGFPRSAAARVAFTDYAIANTGRYLALYPNIFRGVGVWNELNGSNSGYNANYSDQQVDDYVALMAEFYPRHKAAFPNIPIIGGAFILVPTGGIKKMFARGLGPYIDGLDVHPYIKVESFPYVFREARRVMTDAGYPNMPIWVSEWGSASLGSNPPELAKYVFRGLSMLLSLNLEMASYYLTANSPLLGATNGLLTAGSAAPPYELREPGVVYQYYVPKLMEVQTALPSSARQPNLGIMPFINKDGSKWWMCWSSGETLPIQVTGTHVARDRYGAEVTNSTVYNVDSAGIAIFGATAVTEYYPNNQFLFHSLDYDLVQDENGWKYGARSGLRTELPMAVIDGNEERSWRESTYNRAAISRGKMNPGTTGSGSTVTGTASYRSFAIPAPPDPTKPWIEISFNVNRSSTAGDGTTLTVRYGEQVIYHEYAILNAVPRTARVIVAAQAPGTRCELLVGTPPNVPASRDFDDMTITFFKGEWTSEAPSSGTLPVIIGALQLVDRVSEFTSTQGTYNWTFGSMFSMDSLVQATTYDNATGKWLGQGGAYVSASRRMPGLVNGNIPVWSYERYLISNPATPYQQLKFDMRRPSTGANDDGHTYLLFRRRGSVITQIQGEEPMAPSGTLTFDGVISTQTNDELFIVTAPGVGRTANRNYDEPIAGLQMSTSSATSETLGTSNVRLPVHDLVGDFPSSGPVAGRRTFMSVTEGVTTTMTAAAGAYTAPDLAAAKVTSTGMFAGLDGNQPGITIDRVTIKPGEDRVAIWGTVAKSGTAGDATVRINRVRGSTRLTLFAKVLTTALGTVPVDIVVDVQPGDHIDTLIATTAPNLQAVAMSRLLTVATTTRAVTTNAVDPVAMPLMSLAGSFSQVQGQSGIRYLRRLGGTDTEMTPGTSTNIGKWVLSGTPAQIGVGNIHPPANGQTVLQITIPSHHPADNDLIAVVKMTRSSSGGDGNTVELARKKGATRTIYRTDTVLPTETFTDTTQLPLVAGDLLEVCVGSNGTTDFDAMSLVVTLFSVPA